MATRKKGEEPPKDEKVEKDDAETGEAESGSQKIGRKTLALILGHLEKREEKNDEIVQKQSRQGWIIAVLLVLGLLASVGVAGAVKLYGVDLKFTPESEAPPTPAPAGQ